MMLALLALAAWIAADEAAPPIVHKKQVDLAAPCQRVFDLWTRAEGLRAFLAKDALVEPFAGGKYELIMLPGKDGERGTEGCRLLALVPPRLIAFEWIAPPAFAEARPTKTTVVLDLEPKGDGCTLRLMQGGFGTGGKWDEVTAYFDRSFNVVLERLRGYLAQHDTVPDGAAPRESWQVEATLESDRPRAALFAAFADPSRWLDAAARAPEQSRVTGSIANEWLFAAGAAPFGLKADGATIDAVALRFAGEGEATGSVRATICYRAGEPEREAAAKALAAALAALPARIAAATDDANRGH